MTYEALFWLQIGINIGMLLTILPIWIGIRRLLRLLGAEH